MVLMANGSLTRGDFFQQKKLKTVEVGSCRVVEKKRGSAVRDFFLGERGKLEQRA